MATPFQSTALIARPSYPNSVAWSDENLVAVATGHIITILNPASLYGPRGLITLPPIKPFQIGVVAKQDLLDGCMLPTCLSRDTSPCVRSISWSPIGLAPNSGCLLAVCTTDGRVKLYRQPVYEFCAEWVEVIDISDLLLDHLLPNDLGEAVVPSSSDFCFLKQNGDQRFWINGKIEHIDGAKALVQYPKTRTRKEKEWVELNTKSDQTIDLHVQSGIEPACAAPFPKVRPSMNMGNLPEQISLLEFHEMESILSQGQAVEAWLDNRWREGLFVGCNENGLLVKLSGEDNCVTLDSRSIRLAPSWNRSLNSWEVTLLKMNLQDLESEEVVELKSKRLRENITRRCFSVSQFEGKSSKKKSESGSCPQISARQYVSLNAMLSSTIVAWSPVLRLSLETDSTHMNSLPNYFSLLSVGGKSGKISFWRIHEPQSYSIVQNGVHVDVIHVGLLQAHNGWITAICWEIFAINSSISQVVLATGSSDGSLKIWEVDTEELLTSSELNCSSIRLLMEVTPATSTPVSVLSLTAPAESLGKVLLAVGRGSGLLEVWICDISSCEFQISGSYDAHIQVITGLTWAFNGRSLYSCSQLPQASDSCFGLALSPGNLVLTVVHGFDIDLLDPMYEVRTQKAGLEFFLIGGQQLGPSPERCLEFGAERCPDFSEGEMVCWESNILWSLKQYECVDKPLVIWDVIASFLAIKHSAKSYELCIMMKWISSWCGGCDAGSSMKKMLFHVSQITSKLPSRQLHLLNVICRRFVLSGLKVDIHNSEMYDLEGVGVEDEHLNLWNNVLDSSERELRERLVAFNFAVVLWQASFSATNVAVGRQWLPVGIAQMEQWIATSPGGVQDPLKLLASKIKKLGKRFALLLHCGTVSAAGDQLVNWHLSVSLQYPNFLWI
ncbi:hypothetical protein IFM89_026360 [Coptis chinensis]|uniref:Transcription factor IIIC 90kDa subunit N-terminal domain-containing protein n=1 Tax=Coptis chinensis TaxID=261450 RepID=A0A835LRK5_9MAGN|nr:hypothetical protein IFM89_026360 [Coptis chinensis]